MEDTTILTYPLTSLDSLNDILQKHPDVARLFCLSCFRQINILLNRSSISELNCSELYRTLTDDIATYNTLCSRYRLQARSLEHFDELNAFLGDDSPDIWLNGYYMGLSRILASDNYRILVQESDLSIGMLRKGSLDFRRTYQSLEEQFHYLQQVGSFYFRESGNDLFDFYTSLFYKLGQDNEDSKAVYDRIHRMLSKAGDLSFIDQELFASRSQTFQSSLNLMESNDSAEAGSSGDSEILGKLAGSLNTILDYAGSDLDTVTSFRQHVHAYKLLSDRASQDQDVALLRRQLTEEFYLLYSLLFTQTLEQPNIPMPVKMFLYFGYVDEELAGLKNAVTLYRMAEAMSDHSDIGVYTFYDWLMAIFRGKKSPSRNEFDQDYSDYIHKQKVGGNITDAELKALENNPMAKVNYELRNMFPQVNKITFGRITTFCPLFCADDVLKDLESSYVTVSRVSQILEEIRRVEKLVSEKIRANYPLEEHRNMPIAEAKALGAMALFGEKYGDEVRVVKYGSSVELCGGTHIPATGMIGSLRVIGESSIAAGVRRIEAVTAEGAEQFVYAQQDLIRELRALMNHMPNLAQAMKKSIEENAEMKKQIEDYIREKSMRLKEEIVAKASESNGIKVMQFVGKANVDAMKNVAFQIKAETTDSFVFVAGIIDDNKCTLMLMLSDDLVKEGLHAGKIVKEAAKHIQGGGGGQPHFATAGGKNMEGLSIAVGAVKEAVGVQ